MAAPVTPRRVDIDRDGDLTLVVGPERRKFLVCSRALSRGSPVFKQMLYGASQWKESRPKGESQLPWIVKLPDDNPDATKTLLEIIHGRISHVPRTCATMEELYEILVVANKYDMTEHLRPWAQGWVTSLPSFLDKQHAIWPALGVAMELGSERIIQHFHWRLMTETKCDQEGSLQVELASGKKITLGTAGVALTPFDAIDLASKVRAMFLVHILEAVVQRMVTNLQKKLLSSPPNQEDTTERRICESTLLGLFVPSLASLQTLSPQVWLRKGEVEISETWNTSIQEITGILESIKSSNFLNRPHSAHRCKIVNDLKRFDWEFELYDLSSCSGDPDETRSYMAKQRAKLGNLTFPPLTPPGPSPV